MIGLLFLVAVICCGGWFAWLYFVSPKSDQDRIKADQDGTDAEVLNVERIGTRQVRADLTWVAGHPAPRNGGKWFRIYQVTAAKEGGFTVEYEIAVEARLFGRPEVRRIEWGT